MIDINESVNDVHRVIIQKFVGKMKVQSFCRKRTLQHLTRIFYFFVLRSFKFVHLNLNLNSFEPKLSKWSIKKQKIKCFEKEEN